MVISKYRARVAALEEELHRLEPSPPSSGCHDGNSAAELGAFQYTGM